MVEGLSAKARDALLTAKPQSFADGKTHYFIQRTLGWRAYFSDGKEGRADVAELYRMGLVEEWFAPDCKPLVLTPAGEQAFQALAA